MKRDPRLQGLSSEHHQALVLARALMRQHPTFDRAAGAALADRFARELEPHFQVEEDLLLPALLQAGATTLVERTRADHAFLRAAVVAAQQGDGAAAETFAARLTEHVRFEERELFPACEARLAPAVLDEVLRRAPKK